MARQANDGRRVRPDQTRSTGAAVLDRPEPDTPKTQTKRSASGGNTPSAAALQQGRLAERAQADLFEGDDRAVVESLNGMLDSVIKPVERVRRVRGPHLQGRHPAQDHRHLQRRLQRDQEQPQRLHRRPQPAGGRRSGADAGDAGRQAGHARRRRPNTRATSARSSKAST